MDWLPLKTVMDLINQMSPATWTLDWGLKYIEVRIDTRDLHCLVYDGRNHEVISLERIQIALNKSAERFPTITKTHNDKKP